MKSISFLAIGIYFMLVSLSVVIPYLVLPNKLMATLAFIGGASFVAQACIEWCSARKVK